MKLKWLYQLIANGAVGDINIHIHNEEDNNYICITVIEPTNHTHGHMLNIDGKCVDLLLDKLATLLDEHVTEHEVE